MAPQEYQWFPDFLQFFSQNTTIHGLNFIGNRRIYKAERIFWLLTVTVAFGIISYLVKSNWEHYNANPTMVTIKKDFRNWENPFPAATACFVDKVDKEKATEYIRKKWRINETDNKFEYYMNYVKAVSNLTYTTFNLLEPYEHDLTLNDVDMVDLVTQVHPKLSGTLVTFHTRVKTDWEIILTELGLCFTVNSGFSALLSPNYTSSKNLILGMKKENLKCHYLNGLCYARYDSEPDKSLQYYIHSHLDVIHTTSEAPFLVGNSEEFEINFKLSETYSSPNIRYLSPQQRRCRFDDEPLTKNVPVYSKSICYMECRYKMAIKMCGCKPYFYKFIGGKVCDIQGLLCLSSLAHIFNQSFEYFDCICPQPCNLMVYLKETPHLTKWEMGFFGERITFRWGLLPPTTKYHRKILFGFQDFTGTLFIP
ncbi:hypothetical protein GWI33_019836 [Rhynchophorus ferrugineus]|uniref:Uncharacterized protein n=1 Tax=Rhynchophorus ferrugineus TaxID=354439 RepID=A0A834M6K8_RHYFE|nr:hypothetical protein GWI33_019836 [Rhynchophorus ferrugineus]